MAKIYNHPLPPLLFLMPSLSSPPKLAFYIAERKKNRGKKESLSIHDFKVWETQLRRQNKTGNNTQRFVDHPCRKQSISHQLALEKKTCSGFALLIVKSGLGYLGILFFRRLVIWVEKKGSRVVNLGENRGGNVN